MRKLLILFLLLLTATAYAAEPANPADPAMVAQLLPGYTFVEGIDDGYELRLLMRNTENELVFIGGVARDGAWRFTESSPLPEGTFMDEAGALIIPAGADPLTVTLQPYADGDWGLACIVPASKPCQKIHLYRHAVFANFFSENAMLGDHPWSSVAMIDWASLPVTLEAAAAALDTTHWAVTSSPDPLDLIHLRSAPRSDADTLGSYYNRTPVYIREAGREWCAVTIGGVDGYIMTQYMVNGARLGEVPAAAPVALPVADQTRMHIRPARSSNYVLRKMEYPDSPIILGKTGWWYHVWLPDTEEYGYVHVDDL